MAVKLSGPVGMRNRTTNVKNAKADQAIVIDLLSKIGDKCGGKGTSWATPPAPGADGSCPRSLADAIWDFQTVWQARGLLRTVDGVVDPGGHTFSHLVAMTSGGCGPKIDAQFKTVLTKIQSDFRSWDSAKQDNACTKILIPVEPAKTGPTPTFKDIAQNPTKLLSLGGLKPDINGWDVLPLFQGHAQWLRSARVTSKGCGVPSSSKPSAGAFDPAHEDPCTCSDSVQIGGKCWLAGTVNYGSFGIMVKLCAEAFLPSFAQGILLTYAEGLIRGYKQFINKEDPSLPIAWMKATFNGGVGATPAGTGNRPNCRCSCPLDGSLVTWDYVWEPAKPRMKAAAPVVPELQRET